MRANLALSLLSIANRALIEHTDEEKKRGFSRFENALGGKVEA
jgi:hypothetical protein